MCAPTATRLGLFTFAARMPAPPPEPETEEAGGGAERCVHQELWLACAGPTCTVPPVGAAVYYFPQGHAEQADAAVDLPAARVPPLVPCRVVGVRLMAEPGTDDVFARIRLVPLRPGEPVADAGEALAGDGKEQPTKAAASFAKALTPSDANNGGGFSVPQQCAQTIYPPLNYGGGDPPTQLLFVKDVHGVEWSFRHVYRGNPRRHLLTTGWSHFVNKKKLLTGDNVVFVRDENGDLHVGVRRVKANHVFRNGGGDDGSAPLPGWDTCGGLVRRGIARNSGAVALPSNNGKVPAADVVAAARLAAAGEPFEVVHYPRSRSPEFCVRAAAVRASMQVPWCPGTRFKIAFETQDPSKTSMLFMGTIAGVQAVDPARWPQSPWRFLQVTWDEPQLLQNVTRLSPWLVEPASSMPSLPRFSPPSLPPRIPPYSEPPMEDQQLFNHVFPLPPNHPLLAPQPSPSHNQNRHGFIPSFPFPDSIAAAGIQGARHAQFAPFFSDFHISNLQQTLLFCGFHPADHQARPAPRITADFRIGSPRPRSPPTGAKKKKRDGDKPLGIMLFGHAILTEEQMKSNSSGVPTLPRATGNGSSNKLDCDDEKAPNTSDRSGSDVTHGSPTNNNPPSWRSQWSGENFASGVGLKPGQCKVFVESDAVGRNLDLSALGSFEELCARLSVMFCIDTADLRSHVLYRSATGEVKHVGDEPFSAFVKSARRITILSDAGSDSTGNH